MKLQRSFISNSRKKGIIVYYYLYCITKALHKPLINVIGLENSAVHTVQYGGIVAVVSEVTMAKTPVSNGNVLRHAAVVEAVQKEQTVLPMKYSSVFKDDAGVIEFLKNRYAVFISDLDRLQDKMEMGLRILMKNTVQNKDIENSLKVPPPPLTKGGVEGIFKRGLPHSLILGNKDDEELSDEKCSSNPGIDYLQQKRAYYASLDENDARVHEIVKICHAQFEDICVEFKRDTHSSFSQEVSLNYLIHKDYLNEFKNRFIDLKSSLNELRFLCSGPWPPYHFVSSGDSVEQGII